jgi:cytochrome c553
MRLNFWDLAGTAIVDSHPAAVFFDPSKRGLRLLLYTYFLKLHRHIDPAPMARGVPLIFPEDSFAPPFTGEERMKSVFRLSLIVFSLVFVLSTLSFADAAADYKAKCATCHGPDGKGDTAMGKTMKVKDLGSDEVQKQSDAELTTIIEKGKKPMPAYEGKLTKEQIDGLVKYIRSLKK